MCVVFIAILKIIQMPTFKVKENCKTTRPFRSRLGKREAFALFSGILVPVETSCAPPASATAGSAWTGSTGAMSCLLLPWGPSVMTEVLSFLLYPAFPGTLSSCFM